MQAFMPYFLIFAGLFAIAGAASNGDWFMENRRAAMFVEMAGRDGARAAYVLMGLGFIGGGVFFLMNGGL